MLKRYRRWECILLINAVPCLLVTSTMWEKNITAQRTPTLKYSSFGFPQRSGVISSIGAILNWHRCWFVCWQKLMVLLSFDGAIMFGSALSCLYSASAFRLFIVTMERIEWMHEERTTTRILNTLMTLGILTTFSDRSVWYTFVRDL